MAEYRKDIQAKRPREATIKYKRIVDDGMTLINISYLLVGDSF